MTCNCPTFKPESSLILSCEPMMTQEKAENCVPSGNQTRHWKIAHHLVRDFPSDPPCLMPPKGTGSSCLRNYTKSLTSYVQGGLPICIGRVYIGTMLNQISNHLPRTETQVKMSGGSKLKVACVRWMQKHNLTRCMLFIYCMQCKKRGSRSPNDRSTISTSRTVVNLSGSSGMEENQPPD